MPTILRIGPFRFFFYSNENNEPRHIHVQSERRLAKFWLRPAALAANVGFDARELNRLLRLVGEHEALFVKAWDEFFGN
jgi:hypothetical protein